MTESTHARIVGFAADRHYRTETVDRWLALAEVDGAALLQLAADLKLGENQLADLWHWADDVAKRDSTSLAAVLNEPKVLAARRREVSRNDRLKLVKQELRRLRLPQLVATEERLLELLRQLALTREIRVTLPSSLEGDALTFRFETTSADGLKRIAAELARAAESSTCAEIFALLEEAP